MIDHPEIEKKAGERYINPLYEEEERRVTEGRSDEEAPLLLPETIEIPEPLVS